MFRIVDGEMKTAAFLAFYCHAGYQVARVYDIAQLAKLLGDFHALEQILCLFVKKIQTVPGSFQTKVGTYYADIVAHYLANFLDALCYEHILFVGKRPVVVPFRHFLVEVVFIYVLYGMASCRISVYHSLYQRV